MAENQAQAKGSSATVTVACKLPHGIILREFVMDKITEPVIGGGARDTEIARATGKTFKISGYAAPIDKRPEATVIGGLTGFALTHGVPRDLWDNWLRANKDSDMVTRGLVFAADSEHYAKDKAKDFDKLKNGLEPLDPKNLPRLSRTLKVETGTTRAEA